MKTVPSSAVSSSRMLPSPLPSVTLAPLARMSSANSSSSSSMLSRVIGTLMVCVNAPPLVNVSMPLVANLVSLTAMAWGIVSALGGWMSDVIGRRPILLISLFGTALGSLVTGVAELDPRSLGRIGLRTLGYAAALSTIAVQQSFT